MPPTLLSADQVQAGLHELKGWSFQGNAISKKVELKDFVRAMGFVTSVALLAEGMDHHPDIDIRWNRVMLTLSTHSAGGVTENDFKLAKAIDGL